MKVRSGHINVCVLFRCVRICDMWCYLLLKLLELAFTVIQLLPGVQKMLALLLSEKEGKGELNKENNGKRS